MTKLESDGAASPVTAVEPALAAPAPARANEATTEIEEIATEHMEICMEVNFPESISLEAGVTSSQLAPHVRDGIRSDAASAVERLRAAGAWQRALHLFKAMRKQHMVPNVVTYSTLIRACETCQQSEHALELFKEMQQRGAVPNVITSINLKALAVAKVKAMKP